MKYSLRPVYNFILVFILLGFIAFQGHSALKSRKNPRFEDAGVIAGTLSIQPDADSDGESYKDLTVSGATISIRGSNLAALSDEFGNFRIEGIPPGLHTIIFEAHMDSDGHVDYGILLEGIHLSETTGLNLGKIILQKTGRISGTILLDEISIGISGTYVFIPGTNYTAVTDVSGRFAFSGLPEGMYKIAAYRPGYCTRILKGVFVERDHTTEGVEIQLVQCDTKGSIAGYAFLPDAADHIGINVEVEEFFSVSTIDDGSYRIEELLAGVYKLIFSKPGYDTVIIDNIPVRHTGPPFIMDPVYLVELEEEIVEETDMATPDPRKLKDTDGDTVPDDIDTDDDNDGFSDWDEIAAGTDPLDPNSLPGSKPLNGDILTGVVAITAGGRHTCALMEDGGVKCWGANGHGQLGDDSQIDRYLPVDVVGLMEEIVHVDAGFYHTCAVTVTGEGWCWGLNKYGQLGDGTVQTSTVPVKVAGLDRKIREISTGHGHTCALTENDGIKCWGSNSAGQLGNITTNNSPFPVDVAGASDGVKAITAGASQTCALAYSGEAMCWGRDHTISITPGKPSAANRLAPQSVLGLTGQMAYIGSGQRFTCAVETSGAIKCWGFHGLIGGSTGSTSGEPKSSVKSVKGKAVALAAGHNHYCIITPQGGIKCWGNNRSGQLGDGTKTFRTEPVDVVGLFAGVKNIAVGGSHTCTVTNEGTAKCWGSNSNGQLGIGAQKKTSEPVDVHLTSGRATEIAAGNCHTCALLDNGLIECWGSAAKKMMGTEEQAGTHSVIEPSSKIVDIAAAGSHFCVVDEENLIHCWGDNYLSSNNNKGGRSRLEYMEENQLRSGYKSVSVSDKTTCAVTQNASVRCWGSNWRGQSGCSEIARNIISKETHDLRFLIRSDTNTVCTAMSRGDNKQQNATVPAFYGSCVPFDSANPDNCSGTEYSVPFEVEGLEFEIIDLALAKDATCALTANGGMLCWGSNYRGMLGIETIEQISWPMSMPGLESGVVKIAGGKHRFCALINTGSVLCWGWNHKSRFADTDEAIIHTPTLVQGLDGSALSIAIGDSHTCTIMRDGKVKCWGANDSAQLGNLSMAESLIPLDVPALGGPATKITAGQNHTCAIMDNGKVKCWGSNKCGQIDIKIVNSSPVPLDVISPN